MVMTVTTNDNGNSLGQGDGKMYEGDADGNGNEDVANIATRLIMRVDLNPPELVSTNKEEERELMLIEAVAHIKMARVQRVLYQAKVALAVEDATVNKDHLVRVCTFVVDYRQNMELPVYNKEHPRCTYYFNQHWYCLSCPGIQQWTGIQTSALPCVSQGGWQEGCKQCCIIASKKIVTTESSSQGFSWQ